MTTVIAYRAEHEIVMGSDSQVSGSVAERINVNKFIKIDRGFFGFAGSLRLGTYLSEMLQKDTKSFIYSDHNLSKSELYKIVYDDMNRNREDICKGVAMMLSEGRFNMISILKQEIHFLYIDAARAIVGRLSIKTGLQIDHIDFYKEGDSGNDYYSIGSGCDYAGAYLKRTRGAYTTTVKEAVRRAICSARSKDINSGGSIHVEGILYKEKGFNVCPIITECIEKIGSKENKFSYYKKSINNIKRHLGYSLKFTQRLLSDIALKIFGIKFTDRYDQYMVINALSILSPQYITQNNIHRLGNLSPPRTFSFKAVIRF